MRRILSISIMLALMTLCRVIAGAAASRTLSENDLLKLLAGGVYNARIALLVRDRGINFVPTAHDLVLLQHAGANEALLHEVMTAPRVLPQVMQHPPQPPRQRHVTPPSVNQVIVPIGHNALDVRQAASNSSKPSLSIPSQQSLNSKLAASSSAAGTLPVGTRITIWNWQKYAQYMPLGMRELFEGHHFWKMPADIAMVIGPTTSEKMPAGYNEATKRYSRNVEIVHLPDGHNDIRNYMGGEPFPHPIEPDKGYKLLADLWFAYVPHLLAGTSENPLTICSETDYHNMNCEQLSYVYRQVAYNTDGGASAEELKGSDYWYTEWLSVEEPEELRYTTLLTLYPKDNQRQKELFKFVPSLRRWFRGSLAAACSPVVGTDYSEDDFKRVGFNGGLGSFNANFLGHRQIIALSGDYTPLGGDFPANYYMPLGWPEPSWGNWQLRNVDVVDVRRIPSEQAGYCYGKRIIYEDSQTHYALWEDVYDKNMQLWKTALLAQRIVNVRPLGGVPGAFTSTAWDLKNRHLTNASTQSKRGRDVLIDDDIPAQYRNYVAYSTPAGLADIMK
ncbi:MAG: DUF1329 domain-containing protein [Deltaproteobacteria bacterium]|nr:DUF1329 domain-containing protein [Deltaproteobacteria bacterium]